MLHAQIAVDGDVTDNLTVQWPQDHPIIDLGKLTLEAVVPNDDIDIEFDLIPGVQGIELSGDPLVRAMLDRSDEFGWGVLQWKTELVLY